jgi:uncharacterized SAM-binding protein YcdF (DUF218 family)
MGFLLSKLLPQLVYPLGAALLLQLLGLLGRRRRWGPGLSAAGLALLWLASMPWLSRQLVWGLEEQAVRLSPLELPAADAVLVLGGGLLPPLAPRRGVEVGDAGDRLLTGVDLIKAGKAPWLVVSGGRVSFSADDPTPPEASYAASLAVKLGVPAERIVRSEGPRNTAEEAQAVGSIARERGWHSLLLVTSATHLPRATATFRRLSGLKIVPVACDFQLPSRSNSGKATPESLLLDVLPNTGALNSTTQSLKEWLGVATYRLRGWL